MKDSNRQPTRAIVRGIPSNIPASLLYEQLHPPIVNHFYVKRGEYLRPTIAYLNFDNAAALLAFIRACPAPYRAEIAPNQKIIRVRKSPWHDPLVNTIEADPSYQKFLDHLAQTPVTPTSHVEIIRSPSKKHEKLTPLLKYMLEKKKLEGNAKPANKNCWVFVNSAKKRKHKGKQFKKGPRHAQ